MGLSNEDKKKHPYYEKKRLREEKERWKEATTSREFLEISKKSERAILDHLHQRILAHFKAKGIKRPTVENVIVDADYFTRKICDDIWTMRPYLIQKMLERFDLVKGKRARN